MPARSWSAFRIPLLTGDKVIVLTASSASQISSTYDQKNHGLFTYFFLKGLQSAADQKKNGRIDLSELYDYVKPQVEGVAQREYNNDKIPQLLGESRSPETGGSLADKVNA